MPIKLNGATNGSVELDVPAAVGSDLQITLPATAGTAIVKAADGSVDLGSVDIDSSGNVEFTSTSSAATQQILFSDATSGRGKIVYRHNGDSLAFETFSSERLRIDSSGNLLVGMTASDLTSTHNLMTAGGFAVQHAGTTGTYLSVIPSSAGGNVVLKADARSGAYPPMTFVTGGSERMRIRSDGFFSASNNIPDSDRYNQTYHALVSDRSGGIVAAIENSSSDPFGLFIDFSDASPDNNSRYFLKCADSTNDRLYIFSTGDVDNHDNSYGGISDQKLKQDIVDAGSQWNDLKDLRVRKFKFKSDVAAYGDEAKALIGLVAQEAEAVSPGLIKDNPDVDKDGNDLGTVTKTVRYSVLYMKAIKALQEAMERIETLETKVAALEATS